MMVLSSHPSVACSQLADLLEIFLRLKTTIKYCPQSFFPRLSIVHRLSSHLQFPQLLLLGKEELESLPLLIINVRDHQVLTSQDKN